MEILGENKCAATLSSWLSGHISWSRFAKGGGCWWFRVNHWDYNIRDSSTAAVGHNHKA